MLKEIYVQDFILIDSLRLEFESSMSAFTGETGAGKSLLIDAISLLKGARAQAGMVKINKPKAIVEGTFEIESTHPARKQLETAGFDCEDGLFVITREITADGKSTARINHRSVAASMLKELMESVIDIHSQHDTQYLLNSRFHTGLLDEYIHQADQLETLKGAYQAYHNLKKELEDALSTTYNEDDLEFLQYQVNEIANAHLTINEEDELEEQHKRMSAFEKLNLKINHAIELLDGSNQCGELLYEAAKECGNFEDFEECVQFHDQLLDHYYGLNDTIENMKSFMNNLEYDEEKFNQIQERLFFINKLKRKYGKNIKSILEKQNEFQEKIEMIAHRQEFLDQHEKATQDALAKYLEIANAYSEVRKKAAKALEKEVIRECQDLYLENARFVISFKEQEPSTQGIDKIEFLISMNPGERLKPLSDVASGGELSRLMLGLKTIFSRLQGIETVIFDEIDTGVSGKVAFAIGRKMAKIANNTQVFAVTHLASVAACATVQYLVEKDQDETSTNTRIRSLEETERIQTLAMMASSSQSDSALTAARELLTKALS